MVPQVPQQEQELVAGVIQGITAKPGDKWQVNVQPDGGGQYTRNLWTDDQGLVMQLNAMIGTHQTFLCRVSNWTRNDGSPVRSLWIQGVGPQAQMPTTVVQPQVQTMGQPPALPVAPSPAVPQPQVQISQDEREARIHRQTASKVAAILISHLPAEQRTLDNLLRIAENMVAYYTYGIEQSMGQQNPGYDDGGPGPDDDIPF